jgi:uncharacterized protein YjiS (DUF1127 family)
MTLINLLISIRKSFSEWRGRDRMYAELMALDDHSLADIGLHRSQIGALVEGVRVPSSSEPSILVSNGRNFARQKEA